ncbi:hypothetical protein PG996_012322 [Apiospora saccharicola]|uniref:Uncharacterized protein n=1 Tax=Apiospora saccharicola TaxID=335842 RepID=A0ABR1U290_9PEZI
MGDEWMFRVAWNPEAELRNLVGAQALKIGLVKVDEEKKRVFYNDNGEKKELEMNLQSSSEPLVFMNENGEKKELDMELQQPSENLSAWMNEKVPAREGQTDTRFRYLTFIGASSLDRVLGSCSDDSSS